MSSDSAPPHPLQELVGRYDADVADCPRGARGSASRCRWRRRGTRSSGAGARSSSRANGAIPTRAWPPTRRRGRRSPPTSAAGCPRSARAADDPPQPAPRRRLPRRHERRRPTRRACVRHARAPRGPDLDARRPGPGRGDRDPRARRRRKASFLPTRGRAGRRLPRRSRWTCRASATPTSRCARPTTRRFFAAAVVALLDALGIERAHLIGNSLGGRVALEVGLRHPERVDRLGLLAPSLAWRRGRPVGAAR